MSHSVSAFVSITGNELTLAGRVKPMTAQVQLSLETVCVIF